MRVRTFVLAAGMLVCSLGARAQYQTSPQYNANDRFEQLGPMLPTPNTFRTASGAPGRDYFQNRAD